jgi:hypothetical protein
MKQFCRTKGSLTCGLQALACKTARTGYKTTGFVTGPNVL